MSLLLLLTFSGLLLVQSAQDLSYFEDGLDWGGICVTSRQQSPINLVSTQYTPANSMSPSAFTFGTGTNVTVNNLGNQIKVLWTQAAPSTAAMTLGAFYAQPNATGVINVTGTNKTAGLASTVLSVTPLQFHFHTPSEHTLNGRFSALEAHLVTNVTAANTSCASGCTAVFAILYDFSPDGVEGSTFLAPFLGSIPANATSDTSDQLGSSYTLNLTNLFPQDTTQYIQYAGSLTTPPCTEGVSWTVFTNTQPISFLQVQTLQDALAEAGLHP